MVVSFCCRMDSFIYNSKMYIKNNGANIVFSFRNKSVNVKKEPTSEFAKALDRKYE